MKQAWSFPAYSNTAVRGGRRESPRVKNKPTKNPNKAKNTQIQQPDIKKEATAAPALLPSTVGTPTPAHLV